MPSRVITAVIPRVGGDPVTRLARVSVAHFGVGLHEAFVDGVTMPWWGLTRLSPSTRRVGSDLRRAPVLLGELVMERELLARWRIDVEDAAWLRFECSRYEQFDDDDVHRATRLVIASLEFLQSVGRRSVEIGRASKLLTRATEKPGRWTPARLEQLTELELAGPRLVAPPVRPAPKRAAPPAPKVSGHRPGDVLTGLPQGDKARVTVMGEIVRFQTEQSLEEVCGRSVTIDVLRRIRAVRPSGRVWVDKSGVLTTCLDDTTVYIATLAADEWFPGVITAPKETPRAARQVVRRASAADVRRWAIDHGRAVAQRGALAPRLVRDYNAANPLSQYGPSHAVTVSRVPVRA